MRANNNHMEEQKELSHQHHHQISNKKRLRPPSSHNSSCGAAAPTVRGLLCYAIVASLHYTYYWTNTLLLATTSTSPSSASSPPTTTAATRHDPDKTSQRFHLAPLPSSSSSSHATANHPLRLLHHHNINLTQPSDAVVRGTRGSPRTTRVRLPSLDDLTRTEATTAMLACPKGLVRLENKVAASAPQPQPPTAKRRHSSGPTQSHRRRGRRRHHRIPHVVHQTSKSRCVTPAFAAAAAQWHFSDTDDNHSNSSSVNNGWSYYLHDDAAVRKLLYGDFVGSEFPHLAPIAEHCVLHGTLTSDLWRYVLLWVYGGVYADLDAVPHALNLPHYLAYDNDDDKYDNGDQRPPPRTNSGNSYNDTVSHPEAPPDALFVIEQFHLLSQYFMAVSPRHPLMWYAIHHTLVHLSLQMDTGSIPAALVTGPHSLHRAFTSFRADVGATVDPPVGGYKPVQAGTYFGTHNRTVTALGQAEHQNHYINRDVIGPTKKLQYQRMAMRHFQDDKKHPTGQSCAAALLEGYYRNVADLGEEEDTAE